MLINIPNSLIILLTVLFAALTLMLLAPTKHYTKNRGFIISFAALSFALLFGIREPTHSFAEYLYGDIFSNMLIDDTFSRLFIQLFLVGTILTLLVGRSYIQRANFFQAESFSLIFFTLFGMILMSMANEFLTAFIALEISSLSIYILIGIHRSDIKASEAFFKYLILGSFVGAFYLLGMMLIYAQAHTTNFIELSRYILASDFQDQYLIIAGGLLLMITIMFKIAALPFGVWSLDVYDGAPLPITSFMAGTFKIAIFALTLRIFLVDYSFLVNIYDPLLVGAAVITMVGGSFLTITQSSIKRMLAGSSIVHSGYILIGLASMGILGSTAAPSVLFYLIAYFVSAIGAFGVLSYLSLGEEKNITYDSLKGLSKQHPVLALTLSIFMLSLAGFPSTIGFLGKFYVFNSAIEANYTWLALLGALSAFISIYYYFKVISMIYFYDEPKEETARFNIVNYKTLSDKITLISIVLASMGVIWGGIGSSLLSFLPGPDAITLATEHAIRSLSLLL
jgi:NADH-quinone oxidoreductase subunit N